jgi:adenylate kinase family enzyme
MKFPIQNTKELSDGSRYDLNDPASRKKYFELKAGKEIAEIKDYLGNGGSFLAFLVAKKGAGKGTYSKLFEEIFGLDRIKCVSVGDVVRDTHKSVESDSNAMEELRGYLSKTYRGFISIDEAISALLGRSQEKLVPTELILALVKREIEKAGKKAIFLDGLPRSMDQISYSLYFRDLINLRDDPDFFILIDVPEAVIDERMKYRLVCPICKTSRNSKLLPTKFVRHNPDLGQFELICDNPSCGGYSKQVMVRKEGDEKGIEPLRHRLDTDAKLMEMANTLSGIDKVLLRNSIPVSEYKNMTEDYEITPSYNYYLNDDKSVRVEEIPWVIKDDEGQECVSLLAPPVVISLLKQVHAILFGKNA